MCQTAQGKQTKKNKDEGSEFELSSLGASNDEGLSEDIKKEKKEKKKLKKSRIYKKMNKGSWSIEQESMFLEFMLQNRSVFQEKYQRRSHRIFKKMRNYIKTRSHEQCRSHHQKYQQKHHHFDRIVHYLRIKIQANQPKQDPWQHSNPVPDQGQRFFKCPIIISCEHQETEKNIKRGKESFANKSWVLNGESKIKVNPTMINAETIFEEQTWKLIWQSQKQMLLQVNLDEIESV